MGGGRPRLPAHAAALLVAAGFLAGGPWGADALVREAHGLIRARTGQLPFEEGEYGDAEDGQTLSEDTTGNLFEASPEPYLVAQDQAGAGQAPDEALASPELVALDQAGAGQGPVEAPAAPELDAQDQAGAGQTPDGALASPELDARDEAGAGQGPVEASSEQGAFGQAGGGQELPEALPGPDSYRGQSGDELEVGKKATGGQESRIPLGSSSEALASVAQGTSLLALAKPVALLNVPSSGDWLANTLVHLPGMCPMVPPSIVIDARTFGTTDTVDNFLGYFPVDESCPGSVSKLSVEGVGGAYEAEWRGHGFVLVKRPVQRAVDGYNNGLQGWPQWRMYPRGVQDYAEALKGCTVKMLTRDGGKEVCTGPPPTKEEVDLAVQRVQEGFVFVGLGDQLELSVCLLHKMFGGVCQEAEFENQFQAAGTTGTGRLATLQDLANYTDPYDGPLYDAAAEVFAKNIKQYDVSQSTCQWCFRSGSSVAFTPAGVVPMAEVAFDSPP